MLPDPEDVALRALARLHAAGEVGLGDGARYVGAFRAHGLLVPVWDLPLEAESTSWEDELAGLAKRYAAAAQVEEPLTAGERRALEALRGRQLTLR